MQPTHPPDPSPDDAAFQRTARTLRRRAAVIAGAAALAGVTAFLISSAQPRVYQAASSLVSAQPDGGNPTLNSGVFAASPVPASALQDALQSPGVLQKVVTDVRAGTLPPAQTEAAVRDVQRQLAGQAAVLTVEPRGGSSLRDSVLEVQARAATPEGARLLANAGAAALLAWDAGRAQRRLTQLRTNLERQYALLETRRRTLSAGSDPNTPTFTPEQQTVDAAQARIMDLLAQTTALEQSAVGTLDLVSSAALPSAPAAPHPLRSALLAALLTALLAAGGALLLDGQRRRIYDAGDLAQWNVPLLGRLPALDAQQARAGISAAVLAGPWRERMGFVRVNLLSQLPAARPQRVVLSSAGPAEGKSSVTAALALGLARSGERVLIVDADPLHAAQADLWSEATRTLPGDARPPQAPVHSVAEGVDLLPSASLRSADGTLDLTRLDRTLGALADRYSVVLLDTPPLLESPEAVTLAAGGAGLVLIAVPGVTASRDLDAAFEAARTARAPILGLLLNERPPLASAPRRTPPQEQVTRITAETATR